MDVEITVDDEKRQLAHVCATLIREFADRLPAPEVERRFDETLHSFDDAPIRTFIPVLAARRTREELRERVSA